MISYITKLGCDIPLLNKLKRNMYGKYTLGM